MGLQVLLIVAALVPLGILLGLYIYITHGANSSHHRRRRRNRRAISTLRQRTRSQPLRGSRRRAEAEGDDDYLDHVDPSDAYFNEEYLDDDDGALSRGLVEDELDHSHLTEDEEL